MSNEIFSDSYVKRRDEYLPEIAGEMRIKYSHKDLQRLVASEQNPNYLLDVTGNNLPHEKVVRLLLGNIRELVTPGHHYPSSEIAKNHNVTYLEGEHNRLVRQTFDIAYATIYNSILGKYLTIGENANKCGIGELSFGITINLLAQIPRFIDYHRWNVFAHLRDPAVWSEDIKRELNIEESKLKAIKFSEVITEAIRQRDKEVYRDFLRSQDFDKAYPLQIEKIDTNYDGPNALLNHYVAHQLANPVDELYKNFHPASVYGIVDTIARITRELGLDVHPECSIKDANFLDHLRGGNYVFGQTGKIGYGCAFLGGKVTLGGLSDKAVKRHPTLEDFITIGTGVELFGKIYVGSNTDIGVNSVIKGNITFEGDNRIGNDVFIGSYFISNSDRNRKKPGGIIFKKGVVIGDNCVIRNTYSEQLIIGNREIKANSLLVGNRGHIIDLGTLSGRAKSFLLDAYTLIPDINFLRVTQTK